MGTVQTLLQGWVYVMGGGMRDGGRGAAVACFGG